MSQSKTPRCRAHRDDMVKLASLLDDSNPSSKRIFFADKLVPFFTYAVVSDIVRCGCDSCRPYHNYHDDRQRQKAEEATISTIIKSMQPAIALGQPIPNLPDSAGYAQTLALLLYIRRPALITHFIHNGYTDAKVFAKLQDTGLDNQQIRAAFWPSEPLQIKDDDFAYELRTAKHLFFAPFLKRGRIEGTYSEDVILPLFNQKEIGDVDSEDELGSKNKDKAMKEERRCRIFEFDIPTTCHDFKPHATRYVYKRNTDLADGDWEWRALLSVDRMRDDHIIRPICAFIHGTAHYIIFPRYETNLRLYFLDTTRQIEPVVSGKLWQHAFWDQMLGLAEALQKVLELKGQFTKRSFGYHLDLKLANVFVGSDGQWIIADFGRAYFAGKNAISSKTTGLGGNEAYAPPERGSKTLTLSRKYDVFGLAFIFFEAIVRILRGTTGLQEVFKLRRQGSGRFVEQLGNSGPWRVKPQISKLMHDLVEECAPADQPFLGKVISLIQKMTNIEMDERYTIGEACTELRQILLQPQAFIDAELPFLPAGAEEYGAHAMAKMRSTSVLNSSWTHQHDKLFLHPCTQMLNLYHRRSGSWTKHCLGDIRNLRLIPAYATARSASTTRQPAAITICDSASSKYTHSFRSLHLQEALFLQAALTGFDVPHHIPGRHSMALRTYSPEQVGAPDTSIEADEVVIQIWKKAPSRDGNDASPRDRKVVLLTASRICIISIDQDISMGEHSSSEITLRTSRKSESCSFACVVSEGTAAVPYPSISLGHKDASTTGQQRLERCWDLKLRFTRPEYAQKVHAAFTHSKFAWETETRRYVTSVST